MIAGPPNGFKSGFALILAKLLEAPTLFFSADTDQFTQTVRGAAAVTGDMQGDIEKAIEGAGEGYYQAAIAELDHIDFVFDAAPSLDDLDGEIQAFEEKWGEPPHVVVIDNLMNLQAESDNEWAGLRKLSKDLHYLARESGALVIILHHVAEGEYDPEVPAPRKAIQGKVAQLPELILTVALGGYCFGVAIVKNRNGAPDVGAKNPVSFYVRPERMEFREYRPQGT